MIDMSAEIAAELAERLGWAVQSWPLREDAAAPLRPAAVECLDDAQQMRVVRNAGRHTYSHDTAEISRRQQQTWWESRDPGRFKAWLYFLPGIVAPVGYLTLTKHDDGRVWSSMGVLPAFGGHGYAKAINRHALAVSPSDVFCEVRNDNLAMICSLEGTKCYWRSATDSTTYTYFLGVK